MSSFTFDEARLKTLISNLESAPARIPSFTWKFRIDLLKSLEQGVISAFGTVTGRGGYPVFKFDGAPRGGKSGLQGRGGGARGGGFRWAQLKPYTLRHKLSEKMDPYTVMNMGEADLYRYATQVTIWEDTGDSKRSVSIQGNSVVMTTAQAAKMEKGEGDIPARPLLKAAAAVFQDYLKSELAKPDSLLAEQIRKEFKSFLGWK